MCNFPWRVRNNPNTSKKNLAVTAKDHNSVTRVTTKIILNTNMNIINFGNIDFIKCAIQYN